MLQTELGDTQRDPSGQLECWAFLRQSIWGLVLTCSMYGGFVTRLVMAVLRACHSVAAASGFCHFVS